MPAGRPPRDIEHPSLYRTTIDKGVPYQTYKGFRPKRRVNNKTLWPEISSMKTGDVIMISVEECGFGKDVDSLIETLKRLSVKSTGRGYKENGLGIIGSNDGMHVIILKR